MKAVMIQEKRKKDGQCKCIRKDDEDLRKEYAPLTEISVITPSPCEKFLIMNERMRREEAEEEEVEHVEQEAEEEDEDGCPYRSFRSRSCFAKCSQAAARKLSEKFSVYVPALPFMQTTTNNAENEQIMKKSTVKSHSCNSLLNKGPIPSDEDNCSLTCEQEPSPSSSSTTSPTTPRKANPSCERAVLEEACQICTFWGFPQSATSFNLENAIDCVLFLEMFMAQLESSIQLLEGSWNVKRQFFKNEAKQIATLEQKRIDMKFAEVCQRFPCTQRYLHEFVDAALHVWDENTLFDVKWDLMIRLLVIVYYLKQKMDSLKKAKGMTVDKSCFL